MDVMAYVGLGLVLLAVGVILLAYMRPRRRAKVESESEKRIGQARRRQFIEVAQEKRLGLPRRNRDCLPGEMGTIVTDDPLAEAETYLAGATQSDVSAIRDYGGVERRKSSRRTIADRRDDETGWRPNAVDRRQTPGRRREDCA